MEQQTLLVSGMLSHCFVVTDAIELGEGRAFGPHLPLSRFVFTATK